MGLIVTKPVFGVSDKASFKPISSATEASKKIEISPVANLDRILSKKQITKALISLVFLYRGPYGLMLLALVIIAKL